MLKEKSLLVIYDSNNKVLEYTTTKREGYWKYERYFMMCESCPHINICTASKDRKKVVARHIGELYWKQREDNRPLQLKTVVVFTF